MASFGSPEPAADPLTAALGVCRWRSFRAIMDAGPKSTGTVKWCVSLLQTCSGGALSRHLRLGLPLDCHAGLRPPDSCLGAQCLHLRLIIA